MTRKTTTIKELMPPGYSSMLAKACRTRAGNVCEVVNTERITSKYWPEIEKLAMQTDSKAYKARMQELEKEYSNLKATA